MHLASPSCTSPPVPACLPTGDELDADALRKMFSADRVENIMQAADKNKAS